MRGCPRGHQRSVDRGVHRPAIEPRKYPHPGCRRRSADGRQHGWARYRERPDGPAWSKTLACAEVPCAGTGRPHDRPPAYLARLNPSSATPPADPAGLVHFISSPEIAIVRFCSVPFQFGNVLNSTLITRPLSTTEYVPKVAMLPRTTAVFSLGVPVPRLLDANFGRSALVNR